MSCYILLSSINFGVVTAASFVEMDALTYMRISHSAVIFIFQQDSFHAHSLLFLSYWYDCLLIFLYHHCFKKGLLWNIGYISVLLCYTSGFWIYLLKSMHSIIAFFVCVCSYRNRVKIPRGSINWSSRSSLFGELNLLSAKVSGTFLNLPQQSM